MAQALRFALNLAVFILALSAPAARASTIADDLSRRDTNIHWPRNFDPGTAPVFSHNELLIHADCHRVWTKLTDVIHWPDWFLLTKDVTVDDPSKPIQRGTLLHLKIFGSPISSRIDEFVPDSRFSWIPMGLDESTPFHYHTWRLVPEATGCLVITEETGIGPNDHKAPDKVSGLMHRAHDLWLASLRWIAEE